MTTAGDSITIWDSDWRSRANCVGATHLFFPPKSERPEARARRERAAGRLCTSCPVQDPCRADARRNDEHGFWAGESEDDRTMMAADRRSTA